MNLAVEEYGTIWKTKLEDWLLRAISLVIVASAAILLIPFMPSYVRGNLFSTSPSIVPGLAFRLCNQASYSSAFWLVFESFVKILVFAMLYYIVLWVVELIVYAFLERKLAACRAAAVYRVVGPITSLLRWSIIASLLWLPYDPTPIDALAIIAAGIVVEPLWEQRAFSLKSWLRELIPAIILIVLVSLLVAFSNMFQSTTSYSPTGNSQVAVSPIQYLLPFIIAFALFLRFSRPHGGDLHLSALATTVYRHISLLVGYVSRLPLWLRLTIGVALVPLVSILNILRNDFFLLPHYDILAAFMLTLIAATIFLVTFAYAYFSEPPGLLKIVANPRFAIPLLFFAELSMVNATYNLLIHIFNSIGHTLMVVVVIVVVSIQLVLFTGFFHMNAARYYVRGNGKVLKGVRPSIAVYVIAIFYLGAIALVVYTINAVMDSTPMAGRLGIQPRYGSLQIYPAILYIVAFILTTTFLSILFEFMIYANVLFHEQVYMLRSAPGGVSPVILVQPSPASASLLFFLEGCPATHRCFTRILLRVSSVPLTALLGFVVSSQVVSGAGTAVGELLLSSIMFPVTIYVLSAYTKRIDSPCTSLRDAIKEYMREVHLRVSNIFTVLGQGLPARILSHRLVALWQEELKAEAPYLFTPFTSPSGPSQNGLDCSVARVLLSTRMTVVDKDDGRHTWCGADSPDERYSLCYTVMDESDTHVALEATPLVKKTLGSPFPARLAGKRVALLSVRGDATYTGLWSSMRPPKLLISMIPSYEASLGSIRNYIKSAVVSGAGYSGVRGRLFYIARTSTATFSLFYREVSGAEQFIGATYPLDHLYAHMLVAGLARWIT